MIIGENVSFNDHVYLQCSGGVDIGSNVTQSYGVSIFTQGLLMDNYPEVALSRLRDHSAQSVVIGNGVWLAANVTVIPGSIVPEYCVIAAGAVVVGKLEDSYTLYGGCPAQRIKSLVDIKFER